MVRLIEGHSADDNENNIKKLIEVKYYAGRSHEDYIILIKIFTAFFIPLIILGYLHSKSVINDKSYFRISILIFVIMFIISVGKISDMYWRNKMHYDKYDRLYNDGPGEDIFIQNMKSRKKNANIKTDVSMVDDE